jgi:hypothetical protein
VTDRDTTAKVLFSRPVVASGSLLVRIFIILFSTFRARTFQKLSDFCHDAFVAAPAESNPNSRMIRAKTIGVMLMASSIIEKKAQGRENQAERRVTDSKRRTKKKRSSQRLDFSSHYFLKRSKIDISQNVRFLSER